jgi:hypothetical protein
LRNQPQNFRKQLAREQLPGVPLHFATTRRGWDQPFLGSACLVEDEDNLDRLVAEPALGAE